VTDTESGSIDRIHPKRPLVVRSRECLEIARRTRARVDRHAETRRRSTRRLRRRSAPYRGAAQVHRNTLLRAQLEPYGGSGWWRVERSDVQAAAADVVRHAVVRLHQAARPEAADGRVRHAFGAALLGRIHGGDHGLRHQRQCGFGADARFAAGRGIVAQRIRWWKKKLEAGEPSRKSMALLPVRVVHTPEPSRGAPIQVILPSGHIVRVGRGFDEDTFARVMAILSGR
jgi:hypothetical protein